jgi:hypothetical protein
MYLNKKDTIHKKTRGKFFNNFKKEEELDDTAFNLWKSELQNSLPEFWQSINE